MSNVANYASSALSLRFLSPYSAVHSIPPSIISEVENGTVKTQLGVLVAHSPHWSIAGVNWNRSGLLQLFLGQDQQGWSWRETFALLCVLGLFGISELDQETNRMLKKKLDHAEFCVWNQMCRHHLGYPLLDNPPPAAVSTSEPESSTVSGKTKGDADGSLFDASEEGAPVIDFSALVLRKPLRSAYIPPDLDLIKSFKEEVTKRYEYGTPQISDDEDEDLVDPDEDDLHDLQIRTSLMVPLYKSNPELFDARKEARSNPKRKEMMAAMNRSLIVPWDDSLLEAWAMMRRRKREERGLADTIEQPLMENNNRNVEPPAPNANKAKAQKPVNVKAQRARKEQAGNKARTKGADKKAKKAGE